MQSRHIKVIREGMQLMHEGFTSPAEGEAMWPDTPTAKCPCGYTWQNVAWVCRGIAAAKPLSQPSPNMAHAVALAACADLAITMQVVSKWAVMADPPLELCIEAAGLCDALLSSPEPANEDAGLQMVACVLQRWGSFIRGALSAQFARQVRKADSRVASKVTVSSKGNNQEKLLVRLPTTRILHCLRQ